MGSDPNYFLERFSRIELLIGKEKCARLRASTVMVIGLGAVGSYAVEALARSGIGTMYLIDCDTVQPNNINRQLYALESTVGQTKVSVAEQRVRDINPQCTVQAFQLFAARDTIELLLDHAPDLVIDAIDAMGPKVEVIAATYKRGIPIISSMGAAVRRDPRQVAYGDLFATKHCPLARQLRGRLRKCGIERGIMCVYSEEPLPEHDYTAEPTEHDCTHARGRARKALGSLPTITGIFGLTIAHHAIELLCGGFNSCKLTADS